MQICYVFSGGDPTRIKKQTNQQAKVQSNQPSKLSNQHSKSIIQQNKLGGKAGKKTSQANKPTAQSIRTPSRRVSKISKCPFLVWSLLFIFIANFYLHAYVFFV